MPRRKRKIDVVEFNEVLHLSAANLATIMSAFARELDNKAREEIDADLAIAFALYRSECRVRKLQRKPNELKEDLRQIQRAARNLAKLLGSRREAADAMARAMSPELDTPSLVAAPTGPPIYQGKAIDIEAAARLALASLPKHLPYVDRDRGNVAVDRLITELFTIWETYAGEGSTFMADEAEKMSDFVRFAFVCINHVGVRSSAPALAKRAQRLYADLAPEAKTPKPSRRRGLTRTTTGHVVRKKQ